MTQDMAESPQSATISPMGTNQEALKHLDFLKMSPQSQAMLMQQPGFQG